MFNSILRHIQHRFRFASPAPSVYRTFSNITTKHQYDANKMNRNTNYRRPNSNRNPPQQQQPQRVWDVCEPDDGNQPSTTAMNNAEPHQHVTVMSYNVLAQHLINIHPKLYANHHPRHLDWPHRFDCILRHVRHAQPDVLCLQEVQKCHLGEFVRALTEAAGLDAHLYKKRTNESYKDGCAIFYRSDRLQLGAVHQVEYQQPNAAKLLDRPNVALIAHFQAAHDATVQFVVATTHLLYNPRREDVRLAQVQVLLAELDRCAYLGRCPQSGQAVYAPCILTGDFNASPSSATFELLTRGSVRYAHRLGSRLERTDNDSGRAGAYGEKLLPVQLGITDGCQHGAMALWPRVAHVPDKSATWLHNSLDNYLDGQPNVAAIRSSGLPFQTGILRHNFGLRSVYDVHSGGPNPTGDNNNGAAKVPQTATTFHDAWIHVDYMLYSRPWCEGLQRHAETNALRLLQRWRLPSVAECQQQLGRIPNAQQGSDHVSLAAKFRVGASRLA